MENTHLLPRKSHKRKITFGFLTLRKGEKDFLGEWFNFEQKLTSLPCMHVNFGCHESTTSRLNLSILLGHESWYLCGTGIVLYNVILEVTQGQRVTYSRSIFNIRGWSI